MLPDDIIDGRVGTFINVSMHLMVLGASRHAIEDVAKWMAKSLNAPDGAGCFPTEKKDLRRSKKDYVSMHLMVLGASRRWVILQ